MRIWVPSCFELDAKNLRRPHTIHSQPDRPPRCSTSSHRSSADSQCLCPQFCLKKLTVDFQKHAITPKSSKSGPGPQSTSVFDVVKERFYCDLLCLSDESDGSDGSDVSVSLAGHWFLGAEQVPTHRSTFSATKCGWNLCSLQTLKSHVSENRGFVSRIILKLRSLEIWWNMMKVRKVKFGILGILGIHWNPLESLELEWLEWLQSGKVSIPIPPGRHDCVLKFQVHRWHLATKNLKAKVIGRSETCYKNVRKIMSNDIPPGAEVAAQWIRMSCVNHHNSSTIQHRHEIRIRIDTK